MLVGGLAGAFGARDYNMAPHQHSLMCAAWEAGHWCEAFLQLLVSSYFNYLGSSTQIWSREPPLVLGVSI